MGSSLRSLQDRLRLHHEDILLFLALAFIMTTFSHVNGWNELTRMDLTKAMVNDQSLAITPYHNNTGDKIRFKGEYYTDKPPMSSIIGIPAYYLSKGHDPPPHGFYPVGGTDYWGNQMYKPVVPSTLFHVLFTLFTAIFPGALLLVLIKRRLEQEYSDGVAVFTAVSVGLGTLYFIYSAHTVGVVLASLFAYLCYRYAIEKETQRSRILGGVFGGLAVATEYYAAFIPLLVFLHLLYREREGALWYVAGGVIGIAPLAAYNYAISGIEPLILQDSSLSLSGDTGEMLFADITRRPGIAEFDNLDSAGVIESANIEFVRNELAERGDPGMLAVVGEGILRRGIVALKLTVYPVRGLFFYAPLLLVALAGMYMARNDAPQVSRRYTLFPAAILAVYLAFNVALNSWWSGGSYGPRYLIITLPFLAFPIAYAVTHLRWRRIAAVLLVISAFQTLVGFRGKIARHGSALTRQMSIAPGHRGGLIEHGTLSVSKIKTMLYPHSWEHYTANVADFLAEGPPVMAVTTLLADVPWEIRMPPITFNLPVWSIGDTTITVTAGWLVVGGAVLLIGLAYRRPVLDLWRSSWRARIAILTLPIALAMLSVQFTVQPDEPWTWSYHDGSLYLDETAVTLTHTYQPERQGVWIGQRGTITLDLDGSERVLALNARTVDSLEDTSFHITLNNHTVHHGRLHGIILTMNITDAAVPGRNILRIVSSDPCVRSSRYSRCLTAKIRDIDVGVQPTTVGQRYEGWAVPAILRQSYRPETWDNGVDGIWIAEHGVVSLHLDRETSWLRLRLRPAPGIGNGTIHIALNDQTAYNGSLFTGTRPYEHRERTLSVDPDEGWNTLTITSKDGCTATSEATRCKSVFIDQITPANRQ